MYSNTGLSKYETHVEGQTHVETHAELRNSQFTTHQHATLSRIHTLFTLASFSASQTREVERIPPHRHGSATDVYPPTRFKLTPCAVVHRCHRVFRHILRIYIQNAPSLLDALRGGREWRGAAKAPRTISDADRRESLLRCFFISRVRFGRIRLLRSSAHCSHRLAIIQALEQARRRQSEFFAAQHHLRQRDRCCNRRA